MYKEKNNIKKFNDKGSRGSIQAKKKHPSIKNSPVPISPLQPSNQSTSGKIIRFIYTQTI